MRYMDHIKGKGMCGWDRYHRYVWLG